MSVNLNEAPHGDGVVGHVVGSDGGGDGEGGFLAAPVAGLATGAAAALLVVGDVGGFGDGEADPAGGAGGGERGGGGRFGGDLGLQPGLGAGQPGRYRIDRGEPGLDPAGSGLGVVGRLHTGVHPDHPVAVDRRGGGFEGAPDPVGVFDPDAG